MIHFKKAEKSGIKFLNFPYTLRLIRAESTDIKKAFYQKIFKTSGAVGTGK
jgi:hypothetical protein